ncbi:MAG: glutamate-1-semialdehyde 2,1-aminomutase [Candidatus Marinimicrobia bacterium]|nr:glutamate-1-semialdehyde 2,1-aminomutase [Candidatus Neomarinimicrobiota bacterium]MCF7827778.1 glutamate-1-semialdehyde 2,1-aminomutase [Candidatus Neomarinimicrobiota bacterium]MCF7879467.1 glutamate-1-semialdehyde 2,1-aminomutase [Candidatus Neomarinimicrobiota bacterium]
MSRNAQLFEQAKKSIPGGVNSPVRAFGSVPMDPPFIKSGRGSLLWDEDGNEYVDYVGSWGPMILGHADREVMEYVKIVMDNGLSFGAPTALETKLAKEIIKIVPSIEKVRMVNSGTEATMSAIRLARGYTGRDKIIKFEGCYHGHGDSFLIKAGSGALTHGQPNSPGVTKGTAKDTHIAQFNDLDSVQALLRDHGGDAFAAIIVEPVAGNMGTIPPKTGFLEGLRSFCDNNDIVLIFDEVMTGFRVALGGAQARYGVMPDLTTLGKIIGGGMPVGAYGGKQEIMEHVSPTGPVYQAGTLSGNPVAMAAGLKTLQLIQSEMVYEGLEEISNRLEMGMLENLEETGVPATINRVGSMFCQYFSDNPVENFEDASNADRDKFNTYFVEMMNSGIYIAPSPFEAGFVSLAHTEADIDRTLEAHRKALEAIG